jgi:hypothetical protein
MTEKEFWALTPAKFFAMVDCVNNRTEREDYRTAIVTFTVRALAGDKRARLFDEFPEHQKKLQKHSRRTSAAAVRDNMRAFIKNRESLKRERT